MNVYLKFINKFKATYFGKNIAKILYLLKFTYLNSIIYSTTDFFNDFLGDIDNGFKEKELIKIREMINSLDEKSGILEISPSSAVLSVLISETTKFSNKQLHIYFSNIYPQNLKKYMFNIFDWHNIIIRKNLIPYINLKTTLDFENEEFNSFKLIIIYKSKDNINTRLLLELKKYVDLSTIKILEIDDLISNSYKINFFYNHYKSI